MLSIHPTLRYFVDEDETNYETDEINKENMNEFCTFISLTNNSENTKHKTKYDLPCIFVSSQNYILTPSVERHFIGKKILIEAMKSLCGKRRENPKTVMAWTTLLDDECAIPLLKQLTMNAVRLNTAKCSKVIVLQR